MSETLHTCPNCRTENLTARGLAAHRKSKHCQSKALTKTEPDKPVMMKEFEAARKHAANILEHARRASHESILLGNELNRLKAQIAPKHGGDRSEASKISREILLPWAELVEQQTGISYSTAFRCMQLATAAKKHIPVLTASDVLKTPFSALPEKRQAEVVKSLEKAADGQSMNQLMHAFGAWKDKKTSGPPKPTKESAKKRTENQQDEVLQALKEGDSAEELLGTLQTVVTGFPSFKGALEVEDLATWETAAKELLEAVTAEIKARRKAK